MEHSIARRNGPRAHQACPAPPMRQAAHYRRFLAFLERRREASERTPDSAWKTP
jgi:hypothetical protein